ncbi:Heterokaryon incompatibility protein 6 OR allele [Lachnellula suecica]|uniref:Heterokaryon incompatibility protein 6 OR allele n=1 Tax=Lachnellula suecica TaxID=602035 RepID=A0A8T9CFS4_9HELO|nr:Heterokaryon incompatibility protein 6 OR allele [Lachnellula suecica]
MEHHIPIQGLRINQKTDAEVEEFVHISLQPNTPECHPIRLLYLEPSEHYYAPVRCKLEEVNLLHGYKFKALSYAWGDPSITLPILVRGKHFVVTANCHAALLRLREIGELWVWIDAICINQLDNDEKSVQIGMMADVYYDASEVIIWLGRKEDERTPGDEETETLALELIDQLCELGKDSNFAEYLALTEGEDNAGKKFEAFYSLQKHRWFKRLWVLQEVAVARRSRILLQYHTTSFSRTLDAFQVMRRYSNKYPVALKDFLRHNGGALSYGPQMQKVMERPWEMQLFRKYYSRRLKQLKGISLSEVLLSTRKFSCLDARDRVFGILALISSETVERINPNYDLSIRDLFIKTCWAIIDEDQSLEVIHRAGISSEAVAEDPWPTKAIFNLDMESAILNVAGHQVDIISGSMEFSLPRGGKATQRWSKKAEGYNYWRSKFTDYPDGRDPYDSWTRTITGDYVYRNGERIRLSEEYFSIYRSASLPRKEVEENNASIPTKENVFEYEKSLDQAVTSRQFFVTRSGYMGVGPKALQEGDMVCVIAGCNVPLLIRQEGDHHLLVGECFVWGLMDGEAWEGTNINVSSWKDKRFEELTKEDGLEIFRLH